MPHPPGAQAPSALNSLHGPRVTLRTWRDEDIAPFAAMNADPRVMEFFPAPLTPEETAQGVARIRQGFAARHWGLWALEAQGRFIGFTGLSVPAFEAHFTPCVEIGWRLAADAWGRGYATEAARVALAYGFTVLGLDEIVSFTAPENLRSRRVMERIGMDRDPDGDFDHPRIAAGHRLRRHVLYRLQRPHWRP
jgi:ribosomal-protein-alanine N-acetyltransferase